MAGTEFDEAFKDDCLFHFTLKVFVEGVIFPLRIQIPP